MTRTESSTSVTARPAPTPRKLRLPFAEVPRYWMANNAVATHVVNGVNLLFPAGERFFVRSVHHYLDQIDDPALVAQIKGFFGQEGRHARAHEDFFATMRAHGYQIDGFLARYEKIAFGFLEKQAPPALNLAATAAAEHFTAIMAEHALTDGPLFAHAHPVMRDLLAWHAAEEIEHKAVAFDVLQAVDPSYRLRVAGLLMSSLMLGTFWIAAALMLLRQDGIGLSSTRRTLKAIRSETGEQPIFRRVFLRGIREYLRRDFHPNDRDNYHLAAAYLAGVGLAPEGAPEAT